MPLVSSRLVSSQISKEELRLEQVAEKEAVDDEKKRSKELKKWQVGWVAVGAAAAG